MTLATGVADDPQEFSPQIGPGCDLDRWYERVARRGRRLDRDGQLELVRTLEEAELMIAQHVLASPIGIRHVLAIGERLAAGLVDVRDVVRVDADDDTVRDEVLERFATVRRLAAARGRTPGWPTPRLAGELTRLRLRPAEIDRIVSSLERAAAEQRRVRERAGRAGRLAQGDRDLLARLEREAGASLDALDDALRAARAAARDAGAARARLVEANLRLVVVVARRFLHRGLDLPDLVQEGTIGLLRAIDKFERSRGVAFATYATWWIRQAVGRAVVSQARPVRLPINVEEELQALRRMRHRHLCETGTAPSARELAARLAAPLARVEALLAVEHDFARNLVPLDERLDADDDRTHADALADTTHATPTEVADAGALSAHTQRALAALSPKERDVLRLRYGIGRCVDHTLEEIGGQFGVTRQRILQVATRAIDKLRRSPQANALRTFYEP